MLLLGIVQAQAAAVEPTLEFLLVAGGGGGHGFLSGVNWGEGGDGGTVFASAFVAKSGTSYTVTIGGGGAGGAAGSNPGSVGGNSVFAINTATGGVGGQVADLLGGKGDGGANAEINNTISPIHPMFGGLGENNSITGNSVGYGGGGAFGNANPDQFGEPADWGKNYGGGWASQNTGILISPPINKGGGGFGGYGTGLSGSAGGSGLVIIKYPDTFTIAVGAGLTATTPAPSGGFKITTFTSGTGTISFS